MSERAYLKSETPKARKGFWIPVFLLWISPSLAAQDFQSKVQPFLRDHCYSCHGATQNKSGLRLDSGAFLLKGGDSGPVIVPKDPDNSLIIQVLEGAHSDIPQMPYKKAPLPSEEIQVLRAWIAGGAEIPGSRMNIVDEVIHWAFLRPKEPDLPQVDQEDWITSPVDRFILRQLESQKIHPSPQAEKSTLLRRVFLDLIGLPPSLDQLHEFLRDPDPKAYERWVDHLLTSPHFGERWGRHWLDAARYGDSNGYSVDAPRSIWPYRDYVIQSINQDLPYDQFILEQLAGDLLPNATLSQRIATGFHRNTQINQEGGIDPEQFRVESIVDRVNTTGTVFMGLTVGCAQCHDHKFDPITQKEYYQLFAFFNSVDEPQIPVATEDQLAQKKSLERSIQDLQAKMDLRRDALNLALKENPSSLDALSGDQRDRLLELLALEPKDRGRQGNSQLRDWWLTDESYRALAEEQSKLRQQIPDFPTTMVVQERSTPRDHFIHIKGDFTRPGDPVQPTLPVSFLPHHPPQEVANPTRIHLAKWLTSKENPLTARVFVNRVWMHLFGLGLVETENDFGTQGTPPSNPELLDWLALRFQSNGWSTKSLIRSIVLSSTYRQSSNQRSDLQIHDPRNLWLARQNRVRLDAEIIRDLGLHVSGLISLEVGGPGVFPPQPDGVMNLGQVQRSWKADAGANRFRRGLYTFFWRATPHPALKVFDAPDGFSSCTRRMPSNTPIQALTLLNETAFMEFAMGLAQRLMTEGAALDEQGKIQKAFLLCHSRLPSPEESSVIHEFYRQQRSDFLNQGIPEGLFPPQWIPPGTSPEEYAAWMMVARVFLNLDETITRE